MRSLWRSRDFIMGSMPASLARRVAQQQRNMKRLKQSRNERQGHCSEETELE